MSLVNGMPPLQFIQSQVTQSEITDTYLESVGLAFPEIKKHMIRAVCEEKRLPLLQRVLGFGRSIGESDLKKTSNMSIAADRIQWTIQPWLRQPFCICGPVIGNGAGGSDIILNFDQDWGSPGMVMMFQDGTGNFMNVRLQSFGTSEGGSGCYQYIGQLQTSNPNATLTSNFTQQGQCVGWSYSNSAACDDGMTKNPFRTPAWIQNWTTTDGTYDQICTTGIQQVLWIDGANGSRCFQPWQEFQMFEQFLMSFEQWMWYADGTVNPATYAIFTTDEQGAQLRAGYGFFRQVDASGYINNYNISTSYGVSGYNNPANYDAFLTYLRHTIIDWSVQQGMDGGCVLDVYAGINAYALLNDALKTLSNESGGCCFIYDYEDGETYRLENQDSTGNYSYGVGYHFQQYNFYGFVLNLHRCGVFNNPSINGYTVPGQTTPWEAWKFVIMPDMTCDGTPLLQYYSRAGCGTSNAFVHGYVAGTVDPMAPNAEFVRSANRKKGYEVYYMREGVLIVNDPGKCLVYNPIPTP